MKNQFYLMMLFLLAGIFACEAPAGDGSSDSNMNAEEQDLQAEMKDNLELLEAWFDNHGQSSLDSVLAPEFVRISNGTRVASNREEFAQVLQVYFDAFSDFNVDLEEIYMIDDKNAMVHWTVTGTHDGMMGDLAPTGNKISLSGLTHGKFESDGRLSEEIVYYNELDMFVQLGVAPPMPGDSPSEE